ncbi:MAG: hypothetical protein A3F16_07915 [Deltaproteobacteria bacterium RIFCSPHIGHO2_12_FULL_43_9]|nr:MAG: hypothetical protein A3F16_07915 [Deltaproteobacteria bacterium RIFCSPHIGHO2_12_FULL_43_9]
MSGINRNISSKINRLLDLFPAVIILGVRQCGKTFLTKQLKPSWNYIDLEDPGDFDRLSLDPKFFFQEYSEELIIDEAQKVPGAFDVLRGVIDKNRKQNGRFLITGSSSQELIKNVSESLAGRAAVVELGTLKANEIFEKPMSQFYKLFEKKITKKDIEFLKNLSPVVHPSEMKHVFLYGGYPDAVLNFRKTNYQIWMEQYFKLYINRDIRNLFPGLDIIKYRRFIKMLTSLAGRLINKAELARSLDISETTAKDYLDIAHGTFVWRTTHHFDRDQTVSLVKMPRGGFRDSGLLNSLLSNIEFNDLESYPYLGRIFENFVCEEIIRGIESSMATNCNYQYFRTKNGAEIDLIVSGNFGILPIEIKYGVAIDKKKLVTLEHFVRRHKLPFGIVINNSDQPLLIKENILQIPANFI